MCFALLTQTSAHLDGLSLWNLGEDAVQAAVVAERQVAEVVVGVADDGHGGIRKAVRSQQDESEAKASLKNFCLSRDFSSSSELDLGSSGSLLRSSLVIDWRLMAASQADQGKHGGIMQALEEERAERQTVTSS